jgi:hypothetical protein
MNMEDNKKITYEYVTMITAIVALLVTVILNFINNQANLDLQEKSLESELLVKAIEIGDKKKSERNLSFLLKLDLISKDRMDVFLKLTDSLYSTINNEVQSDSVGFYTLQLFNDKKDVSLYEKQLRGAHIIIMSSDSLKNPLHLEGYSDYQGQFELTFPKYYSSTIVQMQIKKKGYKSKEFKLQLPKYGEINNVYKEVFLPRE